MKTLEHISYGIFYNNRMITTFNSVPIPYKVGEDFTFGVFGFGNSEDYIEFKESRKTLEGNYTIGKIEHSLRENIINGKSVLEPANVIIHLLKQ